MLPKKKLGEVCTFVRGPFGGSLKKSCFKEDGKAVYEQQHAIYEQFSEIRYFIDDKKFVEMKRFELNPGDLIMSCSGTMGKVAIVPVGIKRGIINQALLKLSPNDSLKVKYLWYWMNSLDFIERIKENTVGAAIKNVASVKILKEIIIPVPDTHEQQRIVSILDEAFAAIAIAIANTEQNLKNTAALFESYLQGVFENANWETKTLKELTTKIGSGATPRGGQENYKAEGISLVRSMNVHDWEFRERNLAFIDEKQAKDLDGVTLHEDDVLLNITGASVARCCVIPKKYLPARVNQHVSIIRPIKELLNARFLNLLLTSKQYKDDLLFTGEQGATRQAITKAQIETFRISIPSLKEQQAIVQQLDTLKTEAQKLEAIYQKKLNYLEELKKSILQKAFSGELTRKAVEV